MYTKWTSNLLDDADKIAFQSDIIRARPVLNRLLEVLKEDEIALDKAEVDPRSYDNPNWAYRQAHANGYRAAVHNLIKLIDLDQQRIADQS